MNALEMHAREKIGAESRWSVFSYECLPPGNEPTQLHKLTGAIETTGPRGKRKWDKPHQTVWIAVSEHEAWLVQWEIHTGLCHECLGKTQVFAGWSKADGTRYRECSRCGGSGIATTTPAPRSTPSLAEGSQL